VVGIAAAAVGEAGVVFRHTGVPITTISIGPTFSTKQRSNLFTNRSQTVGTKHIMCSGYLKEKKQLSVHHNAAFTILLSQCRMFIYLFSCHNAREVRYSKCD